LRRRRAVHRVRRRTHRVLRRSAEARRRLEVRFARHHRTGERVHVTATTTEALIGRCHRWRAHRRHRVRRRSRRLRHLRGARHRRRDTDHRPLQFARRRTCGTRRHRGRTRGGRRRTGQGRGRRSGSSTHAGRQRTGLLARHEHRALELRSGGAFQIEVALRARQSRVGILRSTIRTEHRATSPLVQKECAREHTARDLAYSRGTFALTDGHRRH
jgi:hypothetical protein